jgi:ubiquinone/menaquinone biosynthesis C-methylase UbiE
MHTLISHVADPMTVLIEARRLLKPGTGRLARLIHAHGRDSLAGVV